MRPAGCRLPRMGFEYNTLSPRQAEDFISRQTWQWLLLVAGMPDAVVRFHHSALRGIRGWATGRCRAGAGNSDVGISV